MLQALPCYTGPASSLLLAPLAPHAPLAVTLPHVFRSACLQLCNNSEVSYNQENGHENGHETAHCGASTTVDRLTSCALSGGLGDTGGVSVSGQRTCESGMLS